MAKGVFHGQRRIDRDGGGMRVYASAEQERGDADKVEMVVDTGYCRVDIHHILCYIKTTIEPS